MTHPRISYASPSKEGPVSGCLASCKRSLKQARRGVEGTSFVRACHGCGRMQRADLPKFKACGGCNSVAYCSQKCQVADFKDHKKFCRQTARLHLQLSNEFGTCPSKEVNQVAIWYGQVPNLALDVAALAWTHRKESPVMVVMGGINSRMAQVSFVARSDCEKVTDLKEILATRFSSSTFDRDRKYVCCIYRDPNQCGY